jgi:hypothetical protein
MTKPPQWLRPCAEWQSLICMRETKAFTSANKLVTCSRLRTINFKLNLQVAASVSQISVTVCPPKRPLAEARRSGANAMKLKWNGHTCPRKVQDPSLVADHYLVLGCVKLNTVQQTNGHVIVWGLCTLEGISRQTLPINLKMKRMDLNSLTVLLCSYPKSDSNVQDFDKRTPIPLRTFVTNTGLIYSCIFIYSPVKFSTVTC